MATTIDPIELQYSPAKAPEETGTAGLYLQNELQRLSQLLLATSIVPTFYVSPKDPKEGQLAIADGTGWNPGSGAGLYIYMSGWQFIV